MTESYKQLVSKLNLYIKKYNLFQMLKGFIFFIVLIVSYFTVVSMVEYSLYLPVGIRTFLFYFSLALFLLVGVYYFLVPLFRLLGLLKSMNYETAAKIILQHFPDLDDRLLNIIELSKQGKETDQPLIWASINEKIDRIKLVDFSAAVSFKKLSFSFLVLFGNLLVAVGLSFLLPGLFTETTQRLVAYDTAFVRPAPFGFKLVNDSLRVKKGDALTLTVKCKGREIPEVLYVNIGGSNYMMNKNDAVFTYEFEHVNNSFKVYFTNLTYQSNPYSIQVLPSPAILNYTVEISPPPYTGFKDSKETMLGDLEVPYGSKIKWSFKTADTDSLSIQLDNHIFNAIKENEQFVFERKVEKELKYSISIKNENFNYRDLLNFKINVIPDLYPEIKVVQLRDSAEFTRYYFKGTIADDYGFHSLNFKLNISQKDSTIEISILKNLSQQDFYFTYDFKELAGQADRMTYYFAVRDNDYLHDYKEAVSETYQFVFPSKEELDELEDQNFQDLKRMMDQSYELSQEIQQSIQQLKFKSLSENSSNWEKQQLISEIMNKKNQLENILNQVQQKNAEMNNLKNSFSKEKAEMIKKQKQIEDLLEDVFNDELKALFEEFNKLAQEFDQSKFDELADRSERSMDDLSKQLERNLRMLKRMKVEQDIQKAINTLSELSRKEKENAQILDENRSFEETNKKEQKNKEELNSVSDNLKKALELNKSLKKPMNLNSMDDEFKKINSNYDEINESLEQRRKKKSVEQIQNNAQQYEEISSILNQMLAMNQQEQNMENIRDLQQLLDNLIYLSLHQELLYDDIKVIDESDPRLTDVRLEQDKLISQSEIVKDSLYALANRAPQIGNVVTKELVNLELSMRKAIEALEENRLSTALRQQQMAITSANNMALFLNEALENLQKEMANSMSGDQQYDKPGNNKGNNINMLKEAQQSLKQQLEQMIEQMKNGQSGKMSEQIGKTLAQQEMMQQMIRELMMSSEVGSAAKEQLKQINQLLEMNNVDLANKNITTTMIARQNQILNKLLKAEKAEMERDLDDQRESKTVDDQFYSNPIEFFEYKKQDEPFNDVIEKNSYQLRIFYDRKYKNYINNLRNRKEN